MATKKAKKTIKRSNVDIVITPGNPPCVSQDPAYVSKKNNQAAHWKPAKAGDDFLVLFTGDSPFDDWYFYPNHPTSKTIVVNPDPNKQYKYTVYTDQGANSLDPGIIIHP